MYIILATLLAYACLESSREISLSKRRRNADMKNTAGIKREKRGTRKRHLIARATFPFDNFLPQEICGGCCYRFTGMLNFDVTPGLSTIIIVIGMHVQRRATRGRGGG